MLTDRSGAAQAQDIADPVRDGASITLEINPQQQIGKQPFSAENAQRHSRPTAGGPRGNRATVAQIQEQLTALGYDPGPVDGSVGERTRAAIIAFQRSKGLPETGDANPVTAAAVQAAYSFAVRTRLPTFNLGPVDATAASGPSFDCARATTPTELAICGDARLSTLDRDLARVYTQALSSSGEASAGALRADQRAWMRTRDACGFDAPCLAARYESRIAGLAAIAGVSPVTVPQPGGVLPVFTLTETSADTPAASSSGPANPGLDLAGIPGLFYADGLPVIVLPNSGARVSGLGRERDYYSVQTDFFRRFAHGETQAAGTFDQLWNTGRGTLAIGPFEQLSVMTFRELTGPDIRDILVSVLGAIPADIEARVLDLDRHSQPNGRASVFLNNIADDIPALDEFDRRRIAFALDERAKAKTLEKTLTGPVDVLLICAAFGQYDFDAGSFPIERDIRSTCLDAEVRDVNPMAQTRLRVDAGRVPAALALPMEEAGVLRDRIGNDIMFLAFPARLIGARYEEQGVQRRIVFEGSRTGPYRVVRGSDPTQVVHLFDDAALPVTEAERIEALLSDFTRPWRLIGDAERQRILSAATRVDFAGLAGLVPGSSDNPLAFTFRTAAPYRPGAGNLHDLMQGGGGQTFGDRNAQRLAEIIGRPTASVGLVSANLILVLPRPAADYSLPPDHRMRPYSESSEFHAVDFAVTETFVVTVPPNSGLPVVGEVLVAFATPLRLAGIPGGRGLPELGPEPEVWSAAFPVPDPQTGNFGVTGRITLARPSDLVHSAAVAAGVSPADALFRTFGRSFLGGDVFARQNAAETLAAEAAARSSADGRLIFTTQLRLRAYDTARQGWDWSWSGMRFAAGLGAGDEAIYINPMPPLDPSGNRLDLIPMPVEEARDLSTRFGTTEFLARIHITMDPADIRYGIVRANEIASINFPYRVHEIEILEPTANPAIDNPEVRIARIVLQVPEPEPDVAPGAGTDVLAAPASTLRILDLSIGDPVATAETALTERMPSGRVYTRSRAAQVAMGIMEQGLPDWTPFYEANLFVSEDGMDMVALYRELPHMGGIVSAITRSRFFGAGQGPVLQDVAAQLVGTFGEPRYRPGDNGAGLFIWNDGVTDENGAVVSDPNQAACLRGMYASGRQFETVFALEQNTRENDYTPPEWIVWVDGAGERWLPPIENPVDLARLMAGGFPDCRGTYLLVWVQGGTDGRLSNLRLALVNPTFTAQIADRNREEMQSRGSENPGTERPLDL